MLETMTEDKIMTQNRYKSSSVVKSLEEISSKLEKLEKEPSFLNAKEAIDTLTHGLLGIKGEWEAFGDRRSRIKQKASWFNSAHGFKDRRATYRIIKRDSDGNRLNTKNIDLKAYWVKNKRKTTLSWLVALTPNFEDEPFYTSKNVGIDFVIPNEADRIFLILSNNYILRVLELKGCLGSTQKDILGKWSKLNFQDKKQLHQSLWESFDLQPINKRFYEEIRDLFYELRDFLCKNKVLSSEKDSSIFTMRLLGRIIFCWFLGKKGFIKEGADYLCPKDSQTDEDYYYKTLNFLFFDILNTPRREREYQYKTVAPYLNGGLFSIHREDDAEAVRNKALRFPKGFFKKLYERLKTYNFTTDESASTYQQVAIDPEMLGKIFENLLAEQREETGKQARQAKGAYYTPREIVDYMCKESLREYLKSKLSKSDELEEDLKKLMDKNPHEFVDQKGNYQRDLKKYKEPILKALQEVKILDPACGSGAFLIGILQAILDLYEKFETSGLKEKKFEIIRNNIYGADIEPMAVELSKLRVWLSLIIDYESNGTDLASLPNLEFKFVCVNSLLDLDTKDLKDDKKLNKLRDNYFSFDGRKNKGKQQMAIREGLNLMFSNELKDSFEPFNYSKNCDFFNPKIMFGVRDGFDIIIGNPPYISHDKILYKKEIKKTFKSYEPFADIYCYFLELSVNLLSQEGIITLITSNSYLRANYGQPIRKFLNDKLTFLRLINLEKSQIFPSAIVNTAILIGIGEKNNNSNCLITNSFYEESQSFYDFVSRKSFTYKQNHFLDKSWVLIEPSMLSLKRKMDSCGVSLEKIGSKIRLGIATGDNKAFILDAEKREELIKKDPKNSSIIKPVLRGRDISRYYYKCNNKFILLTKNGLDVKKSFPSIYNYLASFGEEFKTRGAKGRHWTNLRACAFLEDFKEEKIVWIELTDKNRFALCSNEIYMLNSAYFMLLPKGWSNKYVLGILNSKAIRFYLKCTADTSGMGTPRWIKNHIKNFPIPEVNKKKEKFIIKLVDKIIRSKSRDPLFDSSHLEKEINSIVYKLYNFTEEEIEKIESI